MGDKFSTNFYGGERKLSPNVSATAEPADAAKTYEESTLSKRPVLYLDFDGVLNFFGGRGSYGKRSGLGYVKRNSVLVNFDNGTMGSFKLNYSAELLRKLGELDVDIFWLTTWRDHTKELEKVMQWDAPVGALYWGESGAYSSGGLYGDSSSKLAAVVNDQTLNPRPFLWADDVAILHYWNNEDYRNFLADTAPHLLLEPDEKTGLTLDNYLDMKHFVETLKNLRPASDPGAA